MLQLKTLTVTNCYEEAGIRRALVQSSQSQKLNSQKFKCLSPVLLQVQNDWFSKRMVGKKWRELLMNKPGIL